MVESDGPPAGRPTDTGLSEQRAVGGIALRERIAMIASDFGLHPAWNTNVIGKFCPDMLFT
ncbi:MAG: hypothetical protein KDG54_19600 [Geminicoccaceae bacterium]|nr:hypothetical protein [Geminicoccaceae bacterium]